ncbi:isochorismate synthase [Schinkia azotoformans]|uniref:isochorismate synthase n=1 Tax=Schinkia azotoformans TaxID=1454 RepID=UPI002DBDFB3A|nr:isochorismate synthase [Schinkia azotoformans]MEC1720588.1 isochorismate synthase [Schinkia azotoformans]MED4353940.1 isochorismate synthase [Schinkia azotoformans]MED4414124.1 isochorismate synthase [Schinkia azotoformans]
MVTIQQSTIHKKIAYGVEQAKSVSHSILVSTSTKVDLIIDPVTFYERGKNRTGERIFWSAPSGDFVMVGIGNAYTFESNGGNNFGQVEKEWIELNEFSVIEPKERVSGVGPVILGAFSFDPRKEKTKLWGSFPVSKMMLPQHLLTITKNEFWLTLNVVVHGDTNVDEIVESLSKEQKDLCKDAHIPYEASFGKEFIIEEVSKDEWISSVDTVASQIRNNEIEKVVLAREIRVKSDFPFKTEDILNRLRKEQPSSYIFAVESGQDCFIGASPERLIKKEGEEAFTTCLAGSIARGNSEEEDDHLGNELLQDQKNLHEHEVVVRAIRSAFEQGCDRVIVPENPTLYKVRDIQHLYTPIIGKVKNTVSLLTLVEKLHPTPALGGYPREEALRKIREIEHLDRGLYAGPIGWLDSNGDGEFAVGIRSGLLQGKEASLFAGCGIVGNSDSIEEYKETQMKLRPMLSALGGSF